MPLGHVQFVPVALHSYVGNMIGQTIGETLAPGEIPLQYDKLYECLRTAGQFADSHGLSIHAPRFGAGLARGDWDVIEALITTAIPEHIPVTIYDYQP